MARSYGVKKKDYTRAAEVCVSLSACLCVSVSASVSADALCVAKALPRVNLASVRADFEAPAKGKGAQRRAFGGDAEVLGILDLYRPLFKADDGGALSLSVSFCPSPCLCV